MIYRCRRDKANSRTDQYSFKVHAREFVLREIDFRLVAGLDAAADAGKLKVGCITALHEAVLRSWTESVNSCTGK
jgi:hypothetical protein